MKLRTTGRQGTPVNDPTASSAGETGTPPSLRRG